MNTFAPGKFLHCAGWVVVGGFGDERTSKANHLQEVRGYPVTIRRRKVLPAQEARSTQR
jgi:hypothetical protein